MSKRKLVGRAAIGLLVLIALIQFVPYGHSRANPPVTRALKWDSPETARLFAGACQDCHSNLTDWRWYDKIAPASWLVQNDIQGGRDHLNVSEWNKPQPDVGEIVRAIRSGKMPPLQYKVAHAGGRLSQAQRDALARGIEAAYRRDPPNGR
ncbi:MAG TPA: heme-binding domain-containing protein [Thermoleophilaceae bacterium]